MTNSSLARRSNLFREEVADRVFNAGSFEPEYDDEDLLTINPNYEGR